MLRKPVRLLQQEDFSAPALPHAPGLADDRDVISAQDTVLLIIEDDITFTRTLQDMAHERGFKTLVTASGREGLLLAREYQPDAITLDLTLPDADGWEVAEMLKQDSRTLHIPVHVLSIRDEPAGTEQYGIASYTAKPVDIQALAQVLTHILQEAVRPVRALLVIENNPEKRDAIFHELEGSDIELQAASSASEALSELRSRLYQGIVLDLDLPDMDGLALLQEIRQDQSLAAIPAVVYTASQIDRKMEDELKNLGAAVVLEGGRSLDRLTLETAHFLHRVKRQLPESKRAKLEKLEPTGKLLEGKRVLLVDDDVRNLFALTCVLEIQGMQVVTAENGREALVRLAEMDDIDLVLMDIMMPEMDGYQTMQEIRKQERLKEIPIIALTAKAMKGDRERCLESGASDYASKPVDTDQLLAQMRVWLYR